MLHGSSSGADEMRRGLFTALFALRDAGEAVEYVRRVRSVPRGTTIDMDRRILRQYISYLEHGDPPPGSLVAVAAHVLSHLTEWQGDSQLPDELGRLDEQLRHR
ncbi:hypothetical protein GA0115260_102813 [Streptomyces sp. MnatMP-M27]|nr:hypothetical protein GA0115260_102813 [Streptomyces sp. MnatMP-M27]